MSLITEWGWIPEKPDFMLKFAVLTLVELQDIPGILQDQCGIVYRKSMEVARHWGMHH